MSWSRKKGGKPHPRQTSSLFTVSDERRLPLPSTQTPHRPTMSEMYIIKRDGRKESVHFDKITSRISKLCYGLNPKVRPIFWSVMKLNFFGRQVE